jgi:lipopolysaccharide export system permease protein
MKQGKNRKTPLLLYSYLAAEMLAPFFASFLIINCVLFLVRLIPFLNYALDLNIGPADFIRLFCYLFPHIFLYAIPMASMMGITIAFARLSSDSEMLAFKASGISMYQVIPPVVVVTTFIALLTSFFSIKVIPATEIAVKKLTYQLVKEKINAGIKENKFTEALGDVVVYVDNIDKKTGEWSNVWVSDMRGVVNPVITMAATGEMISNVDEMLVSIVLRDGSLHRSEFVNSQVVQFENYRIDIPLKPPSNKVANVKKKSVLSLTELRQEAALLPVSDRNRKAYLIEFHKRLVLPAGCLLISLIGLPLGLQARPGRKAIGIQAGLAIFILYYIFFTVGKSTAESSTIPVAVCMWTPNVLFSMLALFWVYRIANEQSLLPAALFRGAEWCRDHSARRLSRFMQLLNRKSSKKSTSTPAPEDGERLRPTFIHANAKNRVFHVPECEDYNCANCTISFKDITIAREAGFEPCSFCKEQIELHHYSGDS